MTCRAFWYQNVSADTAVAPANRFSEIVKASSNAALPLREFVHLIQSAATRTR